MFTLHPFPPLCYFIFVVHYQDNIALDDKIPDKITVRLLDPLDEIPAEGEFNPAKRIGLGFVSLLGPDISRVSKIEFTSFIDGQPTNTFQRVSTNVPSPLLLTDEFDGEVTDENLEYGSVFYGEETSTKGAYVNMIASSSGGNFRALVNVSTANCLPGPTMQRFHAHDVSSLFSI